MTSFYEHLSDARLADLVLQLNSFREAVTLRLAIVGYRSSTREADDYPLDWSFLKDVGAYTMNIVVRLADNSEAFEVKASKVFRGKMVRSTIAVFPTSNELLRSGKEALEEAIVQCDAWTEEDMSAPPADL